MSRYRYSSISSTIVLAKEVGTMTSNKRLRSIDEHSILCYCLFSISLKSLRSLWSLRSVEKKPSDASDNWHVIATIVERELKSISRQRYLECGFHRIATIAEYFCSDHILKAFIDFFKHCLVTTSISILIWWRVCDRLPRQSLAYVNILMGSLR